ncbi:DUF3168 domain-containing protein [Alteribacillus sp. YIM 98480]|uniref:DUF3168 domain-containing protein n=1 Tax=Alteribacillus sp. YIM 98480 TaxID=2606599 RepID=UPI00131C7BC7|nr:DUF3168 domain-containing protein [Alteribacillus sp. YIM 98480]
MIVSMWDIQVAIDDRLYNDISEMVTGVHDDPPDGAEFPYVSYGPPTSVPFDTKLSDGADTTFQIDIWSQNGTAETSDIMNAIQESLQSEPLPMSGGFSMYMNRLEYADIIDDQDGKTKHGVLQYRIIIEKE